MRHFLFCHCQRTPTWLRWTHGNPRVARRASSRFDIIRALTDTSFGKEMHTAHVQTFHFSSIPYTYHGQLPVHKPKLCGYWLQCCLLNRSTEQRGTCTCTSFQPGFSLGLFVHPSYPYATLNQGERLLNHISRSNIVDDVLCRCFIQNLIIAQSLVLISYQAKQVETVITSVQPSTDRANTLFLGLSPHRTRGGEQRHPTLLSYLFFPFLCTLFPNSPTKSLLLLFFPSPNSPPNSPRHVTFRGRHSGVGEETSRTFCDVPNVAL